MSSCDDPIRIAEGSQLLELREVCESVSDKLIRLIGIRYSADLKNVRSVKTCAA